MSDHLTCVVNIKAAFFPEECTGAPCLGGQEVRRSRAQWFWKVMPAKQFTCCLSTGAPYTHILDYFMTYGPRWEQGHSLDWS